MNIVICICIVLTALSICVALKHDREIDKLKKEICRNRKDIADMHEKYNEASELIKATEEYTREAAQREKLMQDGISAILNYDALSGLRGEDK